MSDRDIRKEVEQKDAEMLRQEQRAPDDIDDLRGYDKTDADSFPASDPPPMETSETPEDADQAASAGMTGVRPRED